MTDKFSNQTPLTSATLTTPGTFVIGCNYWASHAGTNMWRDWQPAVVEQDFQRLAAAGMQLLRVFPLWPDFQPITASRTGYGRLVEFGFGDAPLPGDKWGQAGISAEAMAHFTTFLDLAAKYELKFIIGLLTGWMSGRLYVPPALEGLNPLTDPLAIRWEIRFVREFVSHFRDHPAIIGWDLGNECNCMGESNREQAYLWAATIANTIHMADPTHPVISGMHSLTTEGNWRIQDQGELTDLLTTHPYPLFTPHCDQDPINTIRTLMHGTAESCLYADLGDKPCFCQETGTLGPVNASEAIAADFARSCLFSLWAHDCHGMLWWCAHEQSALVHPPYEWTALERELGLLRTDGSSKPVMESFGEFRHFLESLPFTSLPPRRTEAVCLLSQGQDQWGTAFSSFILAKQAGFDITFGYHKQPLPEADLYLLPNVCGTMNLWQSQWRELLERIERGATLYISLNDALLPDFAKVIGLEPQTRERRIDLSPLTLEGLPDAPQIPHGGSSKVNLRSVGATVLGHETDGNPAFSVVSYGAGKVYFLNSPLELTLAQTPGVFHNADALPSYRVYQEIAQGVLATRAVRKTNPLVAITEHDMADGTRLIIAINESPEPITETFTLQAGWSLETTYRGELTTTAQNIVAQLPKNDAIVFVVGE